MIKIAIKYKSGIREIFTCSSIALEDNDSIRTDKGFIYNVSTVTFYDAFDAQFSANAHWTDYGDKTFEHSPR